MCIVFLYFCDKPNPDGYRLIMASNRDEYYFRPTATAKFWDKNADIIAGMDLKPGKEGGTWLGVNKNGKFATVTNYRQASTFFNPNAIGRGHLVPGFLQGDGNVHDYLQTVSSQADQYYGFNLLVGKLSLTDASKVGWYCNIEGKDIMMLNPGIHVLSNKVLNCTWPKMVYGRRNFTRIIDSTRNYTKEDLVDKLMELLTARQRTFSYGDGFSFTSLQDEGGDEVYMDRLKASRSIFVDCREIKFGTRTNTVVLVDAKGHATYVERTVNDDATDPHDAGNWGLNTYEFDIQNTEDSVGYVTE